MEEREEELYDFGDWVQQRRKALNLTQFALSKLVSYAEVTIRKVEAGNMQPSLELAERLATSLRVPDSERETFIKSAREERGVFRLGSPRAGITIKPQTLPVPPPPAPIPDVSPYVGLLTFQEADAKRFFGRELLVADLVKRLQDAPFLAVLGPSGSGKSSVGRALTKSRSRASVRPGAAQHLSGAILKRGPVPGALGVGRSQDWGRRCVLGPLSAFEGHC